MIPVGNFLGEAVLHRDLGPGDQGQPGVTHLGQTFRDHLGNRMALRLLFHVAADPGARRVVEDAVRRGIVRSQRAIIEIRRIAQVPRHAGGVEFHVHHTPGDHPALPGARQAGILDGVLEIEQHTRLDAVVTIVHQHGAPFQQVAVAFQRQVDDGVEQGGGRDRRKPPAVVPGA